MNFPEDLSAQSLFAWQAEMEAELERVLLRNTEEALSILVVQAMQRDLTAASARHEWTKAVDRTLEELNLSDDRVLRDSLLEEAVGDEAYRSAQKILAMQGGSQAEITKGELHAALAEALNIETPSLVAAGGKWVSKLLQKAGKKIGSTWRARLKRRVRTGFTGVTGRMVLAELRRRGISYKTWVSKKDDRVRDSHEAADGQTVLLDERFQVGLTELMVPGEAGKPLNETANCRCIIVPGTI